jgi:hypothetical protein
VLSERRQAQKDRHHTPFTFGPVCWGLLQAASIEQWPRKSHLTGPVREMRPAGKQPAVPSAVPCPLCPAEDATPTPVGHLSLVSHLPICQGSAPPSHPHSQPCPCAHHRRSLSERVSPDPAQVCTRWNSQISSISARLWGHAVQSRGHKSSGAAGGQHRRCSAHCVSGTVCIVQGGTTEGTLTRTLGVGTAGTGCLSLKQSQGTSCV